MKKFLSIFFTASISILTFAQAPGSALNPMTAPGAIGISLGGHTLFWENPQNVDYNEVYFSEDSALVTNLDPSTRIYNGYPSTVFNSAPLNIYSSWNYNTKYFWRIVEYNSSGSTPSPLWYFRSISPSAFAYENFFNSGSEGWEIFGPYGFNNWYWSNTSAAGGAAGEMVFRWDPVFIGDSYLISPEFPAAANSYMVLQFNYYEDWWSDTVVVGCAYTTNNGNNWTSIWELHATGNVGPETIWSELYIPGNFRLGFYYKGDSNNIDFLFVDNVGIYTPITVPYPPSFLEAVSDTSELKVSLQWDPGSAPGPITGYQIQRKEGLPTDTSAFMTLITVNTSTLLYTDFNVELNKTYTYRVCTLYGPNNPSCYGNEATAYVPANVPVELVSFTATVSGNNVNLNWMTATETNNSGFEILRFAQNDNEDWEKIGFVTGSGTTTEPKTYSFADKNLTSGNYHYRLKQIDFDGTSSYSNEATVEIATPKEFSLEQNYPNPFNPSTKILYEIPEQSFVTLEVFDVLGRKVTNLVSEEKPAGNYELEFNATGLPSGIYFYQLQVQELIQTKKMLFLK